MVSAFGSTTICLRILISFRSCKIWKMEQRHSFCVSEVGHKDYSRIGNRLGLLYHLQKQTEGHSNHQDGTYHWDEFFSTNTRYHQPRQGHPPHRVQVFWGNEKETRAKLEKLVEAQQLQARWVEFSNGWVLKFWKVEEIRDFPDFSRLFQVI